MTTDAERRYFRAGWHAEMVAGRNREAMEFGVRLLDHLDAVRQAAAGCGCVDTFGIRCSEPGMAGGS